MASGGVVYGCSTRRRDLVVLTNGTSITRCRELVGRVNPWRKALVAGLWCYPQGVHGLSGVT
jgi:hypothetical protein